MYRILEEWKWHRFRVLLLRVGTLYLCEMVINDRYTGYRGIVSNTGNFLSNNFFIYDEILMKFYHDLDIINVNNITISIFVIMLCIVENVPSPYCKQYV